MEHQGFHYPPLAPSSRQLLPATAPQMAGPLSNGGPRSTPLPRKKAHSAAACETCRKRKVKCNAARPACGYCVSASLNCVYTTGSVNETHAQALKRKLSEVNDRETTFRQVFEHLRDRPDSEAGEIVKRIRGGADPEDILRRIREGDLLLQLALAPEARYRYVFPLVQEMPQFLVRPDNPYLNSWVYEWMAGGASAPRGMTISDQPGSAELQSTYCKPYHAAELVDPLLNTVKPSEWTTVSSDNVLMRKMLANFFLGEYQWFPSFQKDYLLQDMASGRRSCCSSLLVNIVLALGSMATRELSNRYEYWNPRNYTYQFLAEAKRLWEIETTSARVRLTTIQAAVLLHIINIGNAMDAVGSTYTQQAVDMAQRIGLFGASGAKREANRSNARVFTAWALFGWQNLLAYSNFEPPLVVSPPSSPLPDPSVAPEWYGQIWLRYPLDPKLYTTHFPCHFKALSEFRSLMNEGWSQRRRVDGKWDWTSEGSLQALNVFYSGLKKWYDNLPAPLTAAKIALPSHLMLHIFYHNLVINMYEPVCTAAVGNPPSGDTQSPTEIRDASIRHLETLIRLYYLRHGFERSDMHLAKCLVQLGFMTLKRISSLPTTTTGATNNTPTATTTHNNNQNNSTHPATTTPNLQTLRSTLILAAKGLHDQGASYFVDKAILRALRAKMPPHEQLLLGQVIGDSSDEAARELGVVAQLRNVRSKVLPSAISFGDDPEVHRLGRLVEQLGLGAGEGVDEGDGKGGEDEDEDEDD